RPAAGTTAGGATVAGRRHRDGTRPRHGPHNPQALDTLSQATEKNREDGANSEERERKAEKREENGMRSRISKSPAAGTVVGGATVASRRHWDDTHPAMGSHNSYAI
ncbi:hypothetical protein ACLOJK_007608, partial [Asimina triloba]